MPSCPPRLVHRPPGAVDTLGPEVTELARECGLELDDWQDWYLADSQAINSEGRWTSFENGLVVPRQNGKGGIIEARALAGLFLFEEQLLTYTAHEFKTAQEHFHRIEALIENTPRIRRKVKRIRKASGAEAVELLNGARLRFLARSAGSGRGFSGDVVFYDEAMILWAAAVGALLPTMSARELVTAGGPQLWYCGTGPLGESSHVLEGVRDRAIAGDDPSLFYAEWAAGAADDHTGKNVDLDNEAEWERCNPALSSGRMTLDFMRKERAAMDPPEFARERLCLFGGVAGGSPIDADTWRDLGTKPKVTTSALSLDVPPEGRWATIGRAGYLPDGKVGIEIDARPGTGWAVDRVAALSKKRNAPVVLYGSGRAAALIPALIAAGVEPIIYGTTEYARACGEFMDKVDEDNLRHGAQVELNLAIDGARKQKVGQSFVWHRRDTSIDISPLAAATLAVRGLKEDPPRRKTGRVMAV